MVDPKKHIPQIALRILKSFLRDELCEEVCGDLEEQFRNDWISRSPFRARVGYYLQVLNYVRPFAIRKNKIKHHNRYDMLQNYFKISWRNLTRNKGYSSINIGGLALGMTIAMLIGLWMHDELTFNQNHENYRRIVQVMQHQTLDGYIGTQTSMPMPVKSALREEYGQEFTHLSLMSWTWDHLLTSDETKISKAGAFVEPSFPEMMTLKVIEGTRDALNDQKSVLLSQSVAKALFGEGNAINQSLRIDNKIDVKVGGVYEDFPSNSTFKDVKFIGSWDLYVTTETWLQRAKDQWYNNSFLCYAQLAPNASTETVSAKIKDIKIKHSEEVRAYNPQVFVYPMSEWHLHSEWKNGINTGGRVQMVWLFGTIGVFVLLLACINFMNLSTARSEKRAKEVGIRMSIGSVRSQLINQFLSESFLVVLFSFIVAIGLVILAMPAFNEISGKQISIPWESIGFWMMSFAFVVVTSLLAGSYPALYLSSFHPVNVLKGTFHAGRFASVPRKVLVVVQFTVSIALVIGTVIIYQQIQYTKARPIGYDREGLIVVPMTTPDFRGKYDVLRNELKNSGFVEEVAESSSPMTQVTSNSAGFSWRGIDAAAQLSDFGNIWVTPEYGKVTKWKIKEGRDFSRDIKSDSTALIINESSAKFMGFTSPIGEEVKWGTTPYHIIGVVEDMIIESPYNPVRALMYFQSFTEVEWIELRLNSEKTTVEALAAVESVFKKHIPSVPFQYKFVDEEYAKKFIAEERIGKLSYVFATLAIVISCLGLFGLASFVAEQRMKEIGIRKVLGATILGLWKMLSKDFVILVLIACCIAAPVSIYFLGIWLKNYQYRVEISWWIPIATIGGALFLTMLTVSYQAIRSARMNPVKSLRSE